MTHPMHINTDVLIVGGGPSGTSAAISLLLYSDLSVTIVEKSNLSTTKVGEHVSASVLDLTDYLKLDRKEVIDQCTVPSYSSTSYWGSDLPSRNDSIFTTENESYQLDRQEFDFMLLKKVVDLGGKVVPRMSCKNYEQTDDNHWTIKATHTEHGEININCKYLIDATGRKSNVCRQIGIPTTTIDKLIGVGAFLQANTNQKIPHRQIIETIEYGWWYTSQLPNNTIAVTLFTDADIISEHKLSETANWNTALAETKHLKHIVSGMISKSPKLYVRDAGSKITNTSQKANFIAIGDAAVSFDPISSMGIGFAMTSGCHAANLVSTQLKVNSNLTSVQYQKDLQNHFMQYLQTKKNYYQQEKRWSSSTFWSRRN